VFLAFILQLRAEGLGQEPELELSNPVNRQKIAFTDFMSFPINVKNRLIDQNINHKSGSDIIAF